MSAQHTPWRLDTSDGKRRILATNRETGIEYALLFDDSLGFHAPDNITLARIVQCVNAHDELVTDRDALLVALRNLMTSVRSKHNLPEAMGWADEAIANSVSRAAIAKATGSAA